VGAHVETNAGPGSATADLVDDIVAAPWARHLHGVRAGGGRGGGHASAVRGDDESEVVRTRKNTAVFRAAVHSAKKKPVPATVGDGGWSQWLRRRGPAGQGAAVGSIKKSHTTYYTGAYHQCQRQ
jgi:hypothetical protein